MEVDQLEQMLAVKTVIDVMTGAKRVGKTSVLLTALNELQWPSVVLDCRKLDDEGYSKSVLFRYLAQALWKNVSKWRQLGEYLKNVKGVTILGNGVELEWGKDSPSLTDILDRLNEWVSKEREDEKFIIALDEAQLLRFLGGGIGKIDFRMVLAYSYDHLSNIKFVLTGSEVGLLEDFLHPSVGDDPLSGRSIEYLQIKRFDNETSKAFLKAGFLEYEKNVSEKNISSAVRLFDGLVGWLVIYGTKLVGGAPDPIGTTYTNARDTVCKELSRLFTLSEHYKYILQSIAEGKNEFEQIRLYVGFKLNRNYNQGSLQNSLEKLQKLSIIVRMKGKFWFEDPIAKAAVLNL
jgi:uncharacterized protein